MKKEAGATLANAIPADGWWLFYRHRNAEWSGNPGRMWSANRVVAFQIVHEESSYRGEEFYYSRAIPITSLGESYGDIDECDNAYRLFHESELSDDVLRIVRSVGADDLDAWVAEDNASDDRHAERMAAKKQAESDALSVEAMK